MLRIGVLCRHFAAAERADVFGSGGQRCRLPPGDATTGGAPLQVLASLRCKVRKSSTKQFTECCARSLCRFAHIMFFC